MKHYSGMVFSLPEGVECKLFNTEEDSEFEGNCLRQVGIVYGDNPADVLREFIETNCYTASVRLEETVDATCGGSLYDIFTDLEFEDGVLQSVAVDTVYCW